MQNDVNIKLNVFSCLAFSNNFQMHLNVVDRNVRRFFSPKFDRIKK